VSKKLFVEKSEILFVLVLNIDKNNIFSLERIV